MPVQILRLSLTELCERLELDPKRFNTIKVEWVPVGERSPGIGKWRRDILIYQEADGADTREHTGPLPGR